LLPCFILGAAFYNLRHQIPLDLRIFAVCIFAVAAYGFLGPAFWKATPSVLITAPPLIYIVCFVGMMRIPRLPFFGGGDYSYGIYLYGFVIQQAIIATVPQIQLWWLHLSLSAVIATLFAAFSWHVIEKPILKLRKKFSFVGRREAIRDSIAVGHAGTPAVTLEVAPDSPT
jgi:peptidoglycan/LPS O-acetylase OafA/YrhL